MPSLSPEEIKYQKLHIKDDRSNDVIIGCVVCILFAYAAVALRFLSRRLSRTDIKADDVTIVLALVLRPKTSF